ncbi:MAG: N-acetylmuramoyl-L-alanine amidase [Bacteroidales bacterium]|nr:N-acetylmuramoyl-L-alanine amidase [Bacteroidales bacterium]
MSFSGSRGQEARLVYNLGAPRLDGPIRSELGPGVILNSSGRGYLLVAGTSTYWHSPFWAPLAQTIYDRLLETGLEEFGVVGAFNYTFTRASQLPAVLVEQAFMTHAEDEEKLADPEFRQQMAVKIYEGLVDYLKHMCQ